MGGAPHVCLLNFTQTGVERPLFYALAETEMVHAQGVSLKIGLTAGLGQVGGAIALDTF